MSTFTNDIKEENDINQMSSFTLYTYEWKQSGVGGEGRKCDVGGWRGRWRLLRKMKNTLSVRSRPFLLTPPVMRFPRDTAVKFDRRH
jgi:hypothetical protein